MAIRWGKQDKTLSYMDEEEIRETLMGRKVVHVSVFSREIELDDGVVLTIEPNEGGCSCGAGDYFLEELNTNDNVITKVEFAEELQDPTGDAGWDTAKRYRIYVYGDNGKINLATIDGDDGSGYYGSGYSVVVRFPQED